jgi:hypothetical protein
MDRNSMFRLDAADRLCRLHGVQMPVTMARNDGRSPAADRHQGYVDVRQLVRLKLRTRVPRIPPSARTLDKKAERGSAMRASEVSPTVMVSGQDSYLQAAKLQEVPRGDLPEHQPAGGDLFQQAG